MDIVSVPFWLELAATLTGGLSGALCAVRARYDIFGVICIAIVTGVAGGITRDVLLQNYGIYAFQQPSLIVVCVVAGIVVFFFNKLVAYFDPLIDLLDNVSVALWAVIGASKGLAAGLGIVPAMILGTITAIGGGIVRDISMNQKPATFQAGTLYGSAAFFGAAVYTLMKQNEIASNYAGVICIVLVIVLRYASIFFGWRTRPASDYTDKVANAVARPFLALGRKLGIRLNKQARAGEVSDAARKNGVLRGAYNALRKVYRVPGETSPLPKVDDVPKGVSQDTAAVKEVFFATESKIKRNPDDKASG